MTLGDLVAGVSGVHLTGDPRVAVHGIAHDSRSVVPGDLFIALPGLKVDGLRFVPQAVERGAQALGLPRGHSIDVDLPIIHLEQPRRNLAHLSARFYGEPANDLTMVGLTGTNGKTTVCQLVMSMCLLDGQASGTVGTLGHRIGEMRVADGFTTPEAPQLHRTLSEMVRAGVGIVIMEVSSIGLHQERVYGLEFEAAGFLNLTADHLDYHGSMEAYGDAKRTLFTQHLKKGATAVLNVDDAFGTTLYQCLKEDRPDLKILTVSIDDDGADFHFESVSFGASGIQGQLVTPGGVLTVNSPLLGQFNGSNIAMAVALAQEISVSNASIVNALNNASVRGRLERVDVDAPFEVVVDYAHTPDALQRALATLRPLTRKTLWCIFGCGGDRDPFKRSPMGRAAAQADRVIITNDNPRSESPDAIADEIVRGLESAGFSLSERPKDGSVVVTLDRHDAIRSALSLASDGDVILIAGKGHETYQEVNGVRYDFDDVAVALNIVSGANL